MSARPFRLLRKFTSVASIGSISIGWAVGSLSCTSSESDFDSEPSLARSSGSLRVGRQVPAIRERDAIGAIRKRIERGSMEYGNLVTARGNGVVFKDEEKSGADRKMTPRLRSLLFELNRRTARQWPGVHVRVTEAWDENGEHGPKSAHYEGRAADLTTSDIDSSKLGRLAWLAVRSGFDWVYFENKTHIHVSVRRAE